MGFDSSRRKFLQTGLVLPAAGFVASRHMGSMLDETTMVLINDSGILSMRPENLFLQKGEADALLPPTSLKIRDAEKYKAILGQADAAVFKAARTPGASAASVTRLWKDDTVLWKAP
jgi:hypothetical protein